LEALLLAVERGLCVPLVYNTSAYDSLDSLRLLDGVVDVYMPDFKLWHAEHCARYLLARDYAAAARAAIATMHAQVGELRVDEDGLALRGVLVRHLVMPGLIEDTREILHWLAGLSPDLYVNLMDQYFPAFKAATQPRFAEINRPLHPAEFEQALALARAAGLWRLDTRWRHVVPHGRPVGLPWRARRPTPRGLAQCDAPEAV
jgi:putative pyruvate formate lyase activating enzyme